MRILLNFYPVRAGGGQQVAANFLNIISKNGFSHKWHVFVGEGSELHHIANEILPEPQVLSIKYNYQNRIFKQKNIEKFIHLNHINVIYSYGPILPIKNIPQVLRTVYSNLYFPEIDFWKGYPFLIKLRKKIIDRFRLNQTLKADGLIFENKGMLERALTLYNYPKSKVKYLEPSVTLFDESKNNLNYKYLDKIESFKILYLSSWHLNKNIHILPLVAEKLSRENCNVIFILSLDKDHPTVQKVLIDKIKKFNVNHYFEFIGRVDANYVHQVVKSSNAMILLSKLECFSSNVMEAFYFEKPLIISDEAWAKAACMDAALFVDRDSPADIAFNILELVKSKDIQDGLIIKSKDRMKSFNSPEQKVIKQVQFLEYIHAQYEKSN